MKTLKDIMAMQPKTHFSADKKLEGVKSSKITDGSVGSEPGVDYAPQSKGGNDFIKLHKVEKHEDRNGNGDDVFKGKTTAAIKNSENSRMGRKSDKEAAAVNEALEIKVKKALGSRYTSDMEVID